MSGLILSTWEGDDAPLIDYSTGLSLGCFASSLLQPYYEFSEHKCIGCYAVGHLLRDPYPWPSRDFLVDNPNPVRFQVTRLYQQPRGFTSYWDEYYCKECWELFFHDEYCQDCTEKLSLVCSDKIYHPRDQCCKPKFLMKKSARKINI